MSKNYFTDEQVDNFINLNTKYPSHVNLLVLTRGQIKAFMNLAVEEAIGEFVAYQYDIPTEVDGWSRIELSRNKLNVPKDTTITQLYSVKELDN